MKSALLCLAVMVANSAYADFNGDFTKKNAGITLKESLNNIAIPSNRTSISKNSVLKFQDEAGFA